MLGLAIDPRHTFKAFMYYHIIGFDLFVELFYVDPQSTMPFYNLEHLSIDDLSPRRGRLNGY